MYNVFLLMHVLGGVLNKFQIGRSYLYTHNTIWSIGNAGMYNCTSVFTILSMLDSNSKRGDFVVWMFCTHLSELDINYSFLK